MRFEDRWPASEDSARGRQQSGMTSSGRGEIEPFGRNGAATMGQHGGLAVRLFKTCVQGAGDGVADPGEDGEEKRKGQSHGLDAATKYAAPPFCEGFLLTPPNQRCQTLRPPVSGQQGPSYASNVLTVGRKAAVTVGNAEKDLVAADSSLMAG